MAVKKLRKPKLYYYYYIFSADAWSISRVRSNNTIAQKRLVIAHYRVGVCLNIIKTERSKTCLEVVHYKLSSLFMVNAVKWGEKLN